MFIKSVCFILVKKATKLNNNKQKVKECNGETTGINKIKEMTSDITIHDGESWNGYLIGYEPIASLDVLFSIENNSSISIYYKKSCQPTKENNFYDEKFTLSTNSITISLSSNCNYLYGGIWFFLVICESENSICSFSTQTKGFYL